MTTEEKAKAYDDAIERFKLFKEKYYTKDTSLGDVIFDKTGEMQKDFENIFYKLSESENEKIINQLIALVNSAGNILLIPTNKEELVAWLNKCKESLHISETCKEKTDSFTIEEERIRKALIDALKVSETIGELKFRLPYPTREECIAYLEKQKEPNGEDEECTDFIIYHPLKNGKGKYECIPYSFRGSLTSFSEDKDLIDFLRTCFYTKEECNEWIEKQKEQKPASISCGHENDKPAEWSEEDEKKIHFLSRLIEFQVKDGEYCFGEGACAISKQEAIEMLKSLRPQPHWKPSEEQMSMLRAVINDPNNSGAESCQIALRGIYEQLKKL